MNNCISHPKSRKNAKLSSALFALSGAAFLLSGLFSHNSHHWVMALPAVLMFLNAFLFFRIGRAAA